jgi:hypothetical protein
MVDRVCRLGFEVVDGEVATLLGLWCFDGPLGRLVPIRVRFLMAWSSSL